jgi:hypothetical protein
MKLSTLITFSLFIAATLLLNSCGPSVKITASWVNRDKIPAQPYKSVFIIALTENLDAKELFENELAKAAEARGLIAYTSMKAFGPVGIKDIAPIKKYFDQKLKDLNCETIFTLALVDAKSETRYVPGAVTVYAPYGYGGYGGYGGFGGYGTYGGFGGYYGYSTAVMSSPGYYTTDKTYFLEGNLFDVKTEEILLSIQSKADNPGSLQKSSKEYTQTLMDEVKKLGLNRKKL